MKRIVTALTATILAATLTGCGEITERRTDLERGKECADLGGSWTWSEWSGYHCEFGGGK